VIEPGRSYRLVRDFEVRDEATGTIKSVLRAGTLLLAKKTEPGMDRVWVDKVDMPLPIAALRIHVDQA